MNKVNKHIINIFKKLKSLLFIFLFTFILVEVVITLYSKYKLIYDIEITRYSLDIKTPSKKSDFTHKRNTQGLYMGVPLKFNNFGLREDQNLKAKDFNKTILFLGDSLTLGWGVRNEDTFTTIVEKKLKQNILNLGHGNFNLKRAVNFLESFLKETNTKPKALYFFYFINDTEELSSFTTPSWYSYFRSLILFRSRLNRLVHNESYTSYYKKWYRPHSKSWTQARQSLDQLKKLSEDYDFKLTFFILPDLNNLNPYPFEQEHKQIHQELNRLDVSFHDLTAHFQSLGLHENQLWVAKDDSHPNALAHQIISKYVLEILILDHPLENFR